MLFLDHPWSERDDLAVGEQFEEGAELFIDADDIRIDEEQHLIRAPLCTLIACGARAEGYLVAQDEGVVDPDRVVGGVVNDNDFTHPRGGGESLYEGIEAISGRVACWYHDRDAWGSGSR